MSAYGRDRSYPAAPKPANFDALVAAAAARDGETFAAAHATYRQQATRAGAPGGTLIGWLDEDGSLS